MPRGVITLASILLFSLQPGDVLLQSQPCFMCSLIEIEEGLPYSHAGVVVREASGAWAVLEAWNRVERVPLQNFLDRRRKDTRTLALRPHLQFKFQNRPRELNQWLLSRFRSDFAGHSYDADFLWNNADGNGEKYYCSEFVAKLINPALQQSLQTKRMHFQKYRDYWVKYFKGPPPDNTPGISPADLARSHSFVSLGEL